MVCRARLLQTGAALPLRSDPCGADPLVRRRVRLLVHLFSNRPDKRAQLCSHRSAQGYTLAAGTDRARTGEFQLARSSTARTFAAVCLSLPRSRLHLSYDTRSSGDWSARSHLLPAERAGCSSIRGCGIAASAAMTCNGRRRRPRAPELVCCAHETCVSAPAASLMCRLLHGCTALHRRLL